MMNHRFNLCLIWFCTLGNIAVAQSIVGTWRSTVPDRGQSDWQITDNNDGTYRAQEIGMGFAAGTASRKGDVLTITWTANDYAGVYEWRLKGDAGVGTCFFTKYAPDDKSGVERIRDGKKTRAIDGCTVKLIPLTVCGTWLQRTPGVGASYWMISPADDGSLKAREEGLGNENGPVRLAGELLSIEFSRGVYEWRLTGGLGTGSVFVSDPWDAAIGVQQVRNGKQVQVFENSTLTRVAPARWSLPVKTHAERGGDLCWGANAQDLLGYFGTEATQAEMIGILHGRQAPKKGPLPPEDDSPGAEEPIFDWYGFRYDLRRDVPSRREIVDQIYSQRKPFAFAWCWTAGGAHCLSVIGYAHAQGTLLVQVLDPWSRQSSFVSYEKWVKDEGHNLGRVLFNITKVRK